MSRRSRRSQSAGKSAWIVRAALVTMGLMIGSSAIGYVLIRNYLHSEAFRVLLSERVSKALDVNGAFGTMRWDGLAAGSKRFEGEGTGELLELRADDIRTEIGIGHIREGYWLLKGSAVRNLEVTYDARSADDSLAVAREEAPPTRPDVKPGRPWFPSEIRYDAVDVRNLNVTVLLDQGALILSNHHVHAEAVAGSGATDVRIRGGSVDPPFQGVPDLRLHDVRARHHEGTVFLTAANLGLYERGVLNVAGEWSGATGAYAFRGDVEGVECADFLDDDWSRRLVGEVLFDFDARNHPVEGRHLGGRIELREGVLTALPLLDSLSAYADTQRFRSLTLHEARADWSWTAGRWVFTNIRIASEGLVRLVGTLSVDGEGGLDGVFRIGLAPGTLSRIPGAESEVFQPGEHGLLWSDLRVTGTLDRPREDLSGRLLAAAGVRMLEILPGTGERVLKNTRTLLGELPEGAVERAAELIGGGKDGGGGRGDLIREAEGLLDGLLRGSTREQPGQDDGP